MLSDKITSKQLSYIILFYFIFYFRLRLTYHNSHSKGAQCPPGTSAWSQRTSTTAGLDRDTVVAAGRSEEEIDADG